MNDKLMKWIEKNKEFKEFWQLSADALKVAIINGEFEPDVSGDVAELIKHFEERNEEILNRLQDIDSSCPAFLEFRNEKYANKMAITALRQMHTNPISEDVQRAIDSTTKRMELLLSAQRGYIELGMNKVSDICSKSIEAQKTIITALHQMKSEPESEDVQSAIEWISKFREREASDWNKGDESWRFEPGAEHQYNEIIGALDLAVMALQRMQKEPCSYCINAEKYNLKTVLSAMNDKNQKLEPLRIPYVYCPACGRKIEVK